jgi:hypothetical protein
VTLDVCGDVCGEKEVTEENVRTSRASRVKYIVFAPEAGT